MTKGQLPKYYKEFLDERFDRVIEKIDDVRVDVKKINGGLTEVNERVTSLEKKWIKVSGVATGAGTVVGYMTGLFLNK
jgi:hypothetical protein